MATLRGVALHSGMSMKLKTRAEAVREAEREVMTAIAASDGSSIVRWSEKYCQALREYREAVSLAYSLQPAESKG